MPQRGDHDVHLYDRREHSEDDDQPGYYAFHGHDDQVKEFLWRARGNIDDGIDDRDFQLITWGADQELILHHMEEKQYEQVGWRKGMQLDENWTLTRRGAPYRTFRDRIVVHEEHDDIEGLSDLDGLYNSSTSPGMSKVPIPVTRGWADGGSMMTYSGLETRNMRQKDTKASPIAWMRGVKFGKRGQSMSEVERPRSSTLTEPKIPGLLNMPEHLSDEIIHVADTFKKVKVEEADIAARRIKVSLNGPWAAEGKEAYVQLHAAFPRDYPEASAPRFTIERTSSIPQNTLSKIDREMATIAERCLAYKRGCLQAVLSYLLGELDLEASTSWLLPDLADDAAKDDESSSDEDEGLVGDYAATQSQIIDEGLAGSGTLNTDNTNVPLPKRCGALWSSTGHLVCFFPPKEEPLSVLSGALADGGRPRNRDIIEGFGRMRMGSARRRNQMSSISAPVEEEDDEFDSSSSSSSSSTDGVGVLHNGFRPPVAWRGPASLRFQEHRSRSNDGSQRTSTAGLVRRAGVAKSKTFVSIYSLDTLVSANQSLAVEYTVFGAGPDVCSYNAEAALRHGLDELSDIWQFAKLILCNDVPLEILDVRYSKINVLAKRAVVTIKRKDSGLDLSFDEPEAVSHPPYKARIKWGEHPFARSWLIKSLFEYFEARADIQTLAMLSCVFAEPPAPFPEPSATFADSLFESFPLSMQLPALTREYAPSVEVAMGNRQPIVSVSNSPYFMNTPNTTYGSLGSVEARKGSKTPTSEPVTPFSTGSSPPKELRSSALRSSNAQNISTSPESHRAIPSATSSFGLAALSRPFQLPASPPQRSKLGGIELSTSNGSNSGVTWGNNIVLGTNSNATLRKTYLTAQDEYDGGSSTEEDEPINLSQAVKVRLKNQHLFDDEAHPMVPLLNPQHSEKYVQYRQAYAGLLDAWGLAIQANEILKYNGLTTSQEATSGPTSQIPFTIGKGAPFTPNLRDNDGPSVFRQAGTILPCSICYQPISGVYKACLACGHVTHLACLELLLDGSGDSGLGCETGCGCNCDDQTVIRMDDLTKIETPSSEPVTSPFPGDLWPHPRHRLSSINRRGSIGESRRPSGTTGRVRQDPRRTSNAALRRQRTRSYEH